MKKCKLILLFVLWAVFGWITFGVFLQYRALHTPIVQDSKINLQSLIDSIWYVVGAWWLSNQEYHRFDEVYQLLQASYYDTNKINTWVMLEKAIKAFVDWLDDPYTVYMDSAQNSWFHEELKWQTDFEGIWAIVSKKDYYVMIEEVIKGSPAYNAWLLALDRIVMVNSWSVKDLDVNEAVAKIRWPKDTKVILTIERIQKDGSKKIIEKSVIREKLSLPSVTTEIFTWKTRIGYINISIIWEETENLMKSAVVEMKQAGVRGIILDLRGNWWWLLPIASEIASHFLPKNTLIVTAKYKSYQDEEYLSRWYNDLSWMPLVVLVDGMTASAWEIIAMALQEQAWATLLGSQTFGKWSIQTMDEFTDGASLKYTVWKWYSPKGKNIDDIGVAPDILVEFDPDLYSTSRVDNQLEKAKTLFSTP